MYDGNASRRVVQDLRTRVAAATPGTRLPAVRELVARHHASPQTVQRAIRTLVAEGLVEAQPGRGTFVVDRPARAPAPDLSWQAVALGPRPDGEEALAALLATYRPGSAALSAG